MALLVKHAANKPLRRIMPSRMGLEDSIAQGSALIDRPRELPENVWDRAIEVLLVLLLLFMPLSLGAVEPWSEFIVLATVLLMSLCLLCRVIFNRKLPFLGSWAYVPVGGWIILASLQLVPIPARIMQGVSPQTVHIKSELLADVPEAARVLDHVTLSFYPPGTRHDLRVVLIASALFVIVANVFRTPRQIKRLLIAITLAGGVIALIALVQDIANSHAIYGIFPAPSAARATGGPFINRSHFAQFMNLSIGAAVGLLLLRLQELFPDADVSLARYPSPGRPRVCG